MRRRIQDSRYRGRGASVEAVRGCVNRGIRVPAGEAVGVPRANPFGVHGTGDTSGYGSLHKVVAMPGRSAPLRWRGSMTAWTTSKEDACDPPGRGLTVIERVVVSRPGATITSPQKLPVVASSCAMTGLAFRDVFEFVLGFISA